MNPISEVIAFFEGDNRRFQWLTPITMGYLYSLTGVWWHFVLTGFSIAGARFWTDLDKKLRTEDATARSLIISSFNVSPLRGIVLIIFNIAYFFASIFAPILLLLKFNHTDIILVGLATVYFGVLLIIIENLIFPEIG